MQRCLENQFATGVSEGKNNSHLVEEALLLDITDGARCQRAERHVPES